jgi:hypothetical protein
MFFFIFEPSIVPRGDFSKGPQTGARKSTAVEKSRSDRLDTTGHNFIHSHCQFAYLHDENWFLATTTTTTTFAAVGFLPLYSSVLRSIVNSRTNLKTVLGMAVMQGARSLQESF